MINIEPKDVKKIYITFILMMILLTFLIMDYTDWNEQFGFPYDIIDEPTMILLGVFIGYLIAKIVI